MKLIIRFSGIVLLSTLLCCLFAQCQSNNISNKAQTLEELRIQYPLPSNDNFGSGFEGDNHFETRIVGIEVLAFATVTEDLATVDMDNALYPVDDPAWAEKYPDSGIDLYYTYSIHIDEIIGGKVASNDLVLVINKPLLRYSITPKKGDRLVFILDGSHEGNFIQGFKKNVDKWLTSNKNIAADGTNLSFGMPIFYVTDQGLILSAQDASDLKGYDRMDKKSFTASLKKLWAEYHK